MTLSVGVDKIQKRKPPISKKRCDNCLRVFNVPSARQFCKDKTCEGLLELLGVKNVSNEPSQKAPKCDKYCNLCFSWYLDVPCATKKCKCGHTLSKIKWSVATKLDNCGKNLFIDPVD